MEIPFDPNTTPGCIPKKLKISYNTDACTPISKTAQFTITEFWKQAACLSTEKFRHNE